MAVEDFSTYTELDDNSRITVTPSRVTFESLTMGEDAWVYSDKGADSFNGDFTHLLTVMMTAGNKLDARAYIWCLTNIVDDTRGIDNANGSFLGLMFYRDTTFYTIVLRECHNGTLYGDTYTISLDTPYYLKIVRDESVGTYGTLYCYIYSDSARTTLLHTLDLLLYAKRDFRYIFAVNTTNVSNASYTASGYSENLDLGLIIVPSVTTNPATAIR